MSVGVDAQEMQEEHHLRRKRVSSVHKQTQSGNAIQIYSELSALFQLRDEGRRPQCLLGPP
jgi:uncharacterized protein YheU (UPF0270 family)